MSIHTNLVEHVVSWNAAAVAHRTEYQERIVKFTAAKEAIAALAEQAAKDDDQLRKRLRTKAKTTVGDFRSKRNGTSKKGKDRKERR